MHAAPEVEPGTGIMAQGGAILRSDSTGMWKGSQFSGTTDGQLETRPKAWFVQTEKTARHRSDSN